MTETETILPLWDHIEQLRKTLLICFAIIFVGMIGSFFFYHPLIHFLTDPLDSQGLFQNKLVVEEVRHLQITNPHKVSLEYVLPLSYLPISMSSGVKRIGFNEYLVEPENILEVTEIQKNNNLLFLSPIEGFASTLKICFWTGLVGTSPIWMFFIFQFIAPALRPYEKKIIIPFFFAAIIFLAMGIAFALYITIPSANLFFRLFNQEIGINAWSFKSYMDYSLGILFGSALAFETALMLGICIHFGMIKSTTLSNNRRYAFLAIFIISAILTPPDVISQVLLAFPLMFLYEGAILYGKFRERKAIFLQQSEPYFTRT